MNENEKKPAFEIGDRVHWKGEEKNGTVVKYVEVGNMIYPMIHVDGEEEYLVTIVQEKDLTLLD